MDREQIVTELKALVAKLDVTDPCQGSVKSILCSLIGTLLAGAETVLMAYLQEFNQKLVEAIDAVKSEPDSEKGG